MVVHTVGHSTLALDAFLALLAAHGIRVFSDLVPSALVDFHPDAGAALLALERAAAEHPALWEIATQLHVFGHR